MARKVNDFLKNNNIDVLLDEEDMQAGTSIMQFIQDCIKKADAVVSIVSSKSLQSGWVGQESAASLYAVWLADKKFIPVSLDTVAFDSKFQITALKGIQAKIAEMDNDISEIRQLGSDARDLEDDRKRLFDLQKEFSSIIQRLKSVLMLDISGDNFDRSMAKVLERINHG
ncbi:MAG: toll/interleukin-1 receptor domain-containing protein [Lewinellaceae bacterium]|nr:toll/interleukin-1 receptor domain-containing protein [Lewinellaceae bacterium]